MACQLTPSSSRLSLQWKHMDTARPSTSARWVRGTSMRWRRSSPAAIPQLLRWQVRPRWSSSINRRDIIDREPKSEAVYSRVGLAPTLAATTERTFPPDDESEDICLKHTDHRHNYSRVCRNFDNGSYGFRGNAG